MGLSRRGVPFFYSPTSRGPGFSGACGPVVYEGHGPGVVSPRSGSGHCVPSAFPREVLPPRVLDGAGPVWLESDWIRPLPKLRSPRFLFVGCLVPLLPSAGGVPSFDSSLAVPTRPGQEPRDVCGLVPADSSGALPGQVPSSVGVARLTWPLRVLLSAGDSCVDSAVSSGSRFRSQVHFLCPPGVH